MNDKPINRMWSKAAIEKKVISDERLQGASAKAKKLRDGAPKIEGGNEDIRDYLRRNPIKKY